MITWVVMFVLAAGVFGQRFVGMAVLREDRIPPSWHAVVDRVPLAIVAAVVALQAFSTGGSLEIDARLGGVAAAALCLWRRLPLGVVVLVAVVTTAILRAL